MDRANASSIARIPAGDSRKDVHGAMPRRGDHDPNPRTSHRVEETSGDLWPPGEGAMGPTTNQSGASEQQKEEPAHHREVYCNNTDRRGTFCQSHPALVPTPNQVTENGTKRAPTREHHDDPRLRYEISSHISQTVSTQSFHSSPKKATYGSSSSEGTSSRERQSLRASSDM
jgi:hypothetical protein